MPDQVLSVGALIGLEFCRYGINEEIGGGIGVVLRVHDELLDRELAITVLPTFNLTDEIGGKRFHIIESICSVNVFYKLNISLQPRVRYWLPLPGWTEIGL